MRRSKQIGAADEERAREEAYEHNRRGQYRVVKTMECCFSPCLPLPRGTLLTIEAGLTDGFFIGRDQHGNILASLSEAQLLDFLEEEVDDGKSTPR